MLSSADELLRVKSISELRKLVNELEMSSESKQTELQQMVGSKYHDFIQSADAIKDMVAKAEMLEMQLIKFGNYNNQVIEKTNKLLLSTQSRNNSSHDGGIINSNTANNSSETIGMKVALSSENIWLFLDECKVFEASAIISVSEIILSVSSTAKSIVNSCKNALFLKQTILDDCSLLLSIPSISKSSSSSSSSLSSLDKAKTLAAYSILTKSSSSELLDCYLQFAEKKVKRCLNTLLDIEASSGSTAYEVISTHLEQLILVIQEIIMDVYQLFFQSSQQQPSGLIATQQAMLFNYIMNQLKLHLKPEVFDSSSDFINKALNSLSMPRDVSSDRLQKLFDSWISSKVVKQANECVAAVLATTSGNMSLSAQQVSTLQQKLWKSVAVINLGHFSRYSFNQDDWYKACNLLLHDRINKTSSVAASPVPSSGVSVLWDLIFRGAFVRKVQTYVHQSCASVLQLFKHHVTRIIGQQGVGFDGNTFTVTSININNNNNIAKRDVLKVNSLRLHNGAEQIRKLLETELLAIATTVLNPIYSSSEGGTTDDSWSFSLTLFIQSSQLLSYILIFLRETVAAFKEAIKREKHSLLSTSGSTQATSVNKRIQCLVSSCLLIGRVSWLLLSRGSFLNMLLDFYPSNSSAISRDYDVSSEEQLISAFEIADTNGDGIVTYSEALDAISALITSPEDLSSDKEGSSGDISLGNLFSSQFTPSLTYAEFNLLLLNLQAQSSYSSALKIVKSSLDYVCRQAHDVFAEAVVYQAFQNVSDSLLHELGFSTAAADSKLGQQHVMKTLWKKFLLPAEEDPLDDSASSAGGIMQILPASATLVLEQVLHALSVSVASFVSADTAEILAIPHATGLSAESNITSNLLEYVQSQINVCSREEIIALYGKLSTHSANFNIEELALQVIIDLNVCLHVISNTSTSDEKGNNKLKDLLKEWQGKIDAIDASLLLPLLNQISLRYLRNTHLLHPQPHLRADINTKTIDVSKDDTGDSDWPVNVVFPQKPSSRFGLLALPLGLTSASGGTGTGYSGNSVNASYSKSSESKATANTSSYLSSKSVNSATSGITSNLVNDATKSVFGSLSSFGSSLLS